MIIGSEIRREIAATMSAFEKHYSNAQTTINGKPEKVAELMCEKLREEMHEHIVPCGKKCSRESPELHDEREHGTTYELNIYHRQYINDVLKTIRRGEVDFVYNPEWLFELYFYEPRMTFVWRDGVFLVSMGGGS